MSDIEPGELRHVVFEDKSSRLSLIIECDCSGRMIVDCRHNGINSFIISSKLILFEKIKIERETC